MRPLPLAAMLAALATAAPAQQSLGTDQGNPDQPIAPGAETIPTQPIPGQVPMFQPDPGPGTATGVGPTPQELLTAEEGELSTPPPHDLTAQVQSGGLGNEQTVTFLGTDGQEIGQARLVGTPHGLLIGLEVGSLPASSWVAFHIHENGTCDPATGFDSAGGHYDIAGTDHGLMVPTGPHAGDMPNQWVGSDGVLRSEVFNTFVQLADSGATVFGRSLVIHDGRDDYQSQPSGDAGNRIACAEIPAE